MAVRSMPTIALAAAGSTDRVRRAGDVTQNQIIYGNVTGGKGFTGPVKERDPSAFFGPTSGGISDRFIAGSSGVPQPYQPSIDLSKTQSFYGSDRAVAPPLGTVRVGYTGTYIGTGAPESSLMQNPLSAPFAEEKQNLGATTILGTRTTVNGNDFGEQLFQTSLANDLPQTTFSGSALYGIQSLQTGQGDSTLGLGNLNGQQSEQIVSSFRMLRNGGCNPSCNNQIVRRSPKDP